MGQTKKVAIYRFMTRATVEERIIEIARNKLVLDQVCVSERNKEREREKSGFAFEQNVRLVSFYGPGRSRTHQFARCRGGRALRSTRIV